MEHVFSGSIPFTSSLAKNNFSCINFKVMHKSHVLNTLTTYIKTHSNKVRKVSTVYMKTADADTSSEASERQQLPTSPYVTVASMFGWLCSLLLQFTARSYLFISPISYSKNHGSKPFRSLAALTEFFCIFLQVAHENSESP